MPTYSRGDSQAGQRIVQLMGLHISERKHWFFSCENRDGLNWKIDVNFRELARSAFNS